MELEVRTPMDVHLLDENDSPIRIGRDPACEIVVDDPTVSRHHLTLTWTGTNWTLEDSSSRGTFRNGASIEQLVVGDLAILNLGAADGPRIEIETPEPEVGPFPPTRGLMANVNRVEVFCSGDGMVSGADEFRVGRHSASDLVVQDASVSRTHVLISREGTEWVVHDESTHGIFSLDGRRLDSATEIDDDGISFTLGSTRGPRLDVYPASYPMWMNRPLIPWSPYLQVVLWWAAMIYGLFWSIHQIRLGGGTNDVQNVGEIFDPSASSSAGYIQITLFSLALLVVFDLAGQLIASIAEDIRSIPADIRDLFRSSLAVRELAPVSLLAAYLCINPTALVRTSGWLLLLIAGFGRYTARLMRICGGIAWIFRADPVSVSRSFHWLGIFGALVGTLGVRIGAVVLLVILVIQIARAWIRTEQTPSATNALALLTVFSVAAALAPVPAAADDGGYDECGGETFFSCAGTEEVLAVVVPPWLLQWIAILLIRISQIITYPLVPNISGKDPIEEMMREGKKRATDERKKPRASGDGKKQKRLDKKANKAKPRVKKASDIPKKARTKVAPSSTSKVTRVVKRAGRWVVIGVMGLIGVLVSVPLGVNPEKHLHPPPESA